MRKIGYYVLLLMILIFLIPILILGGVGSGIKLPGIINKLPNIVEKPKESTIDKAGPIIKVYVTKDRKIEDMYLEDYVRGVVCAEMPVSFSLEALKAQAIAARTFAVASMVQYGGGGYKKHPGADISSDVDTQAWISKEDRFKYWSPKDAISNWNKITEAVEATKGMVLAYNGDVARHVKYFSTSGGKTEDSINVFGYKESYLKSVVSPNEDEAPNYQSRVTMSKTEFINRVKQMNSAVKISDKTLSANIKIIDYTEGSRVKNIKIGDKVFKGTDIRWAMGLKSANFSVQVDKKNVIFNVKGYGHGVGMSQWGANEMGKRGSKYDAILKHYFSGIEIKQITDIFKEN